MATNQTIISISLQRPTNSARRQQRVVCVRDHSPSMIGEKGRAASQATAELCRILASPSNWDAFQMAVVDFGPKARVVHGFERTTSLAGHLRPLHPFRATLLSGGGTNITSGLERTVELLQQAEGEQLETVDFARSVVVLLSDGGHNTGPAPDQTAENLKQVSDLVCVAFGQDADLKLLRRLATSPAHCVQCSSGEELRRFFVEVGVTLTRTLASRADATVALTKIQYHEPDKGPDALQTNR